MINKLTEKEFQKYFSPPMMLVGEEKSSEINIREYLLEILKFEKFKITLDEIEVPHIYFDGNKRFEHILLSYGIKDTFIVIVTNTDKIIGYHILNLKEKYEF